MGPGTSCATSARSTSEGRDQPRRVSAPSETSHALVNDRYVDRVAGLPYFVTSVMGYGSETREALHACASRIALVMVVVRSLSKEIALFSLRTCYLANFELAVSKTFHRTMMYASKVFSLRVQTCRKYHVRNIPDSKKNYFNAAKKISFGIKSSSRTR